MDRKTALFLEWTPDTDGVTNKVRGFAALEIDPLRFKVHNGNHRQPRHAVCHKKLIEKHLPLKARILTNRIAVEILIF